MSIATIVDRDIRVFSAIPEELIAGQCWCLWCYEGEPDPTKVPYRANGYKLSTTAPEQWCDYNTALETYQTGQNASGKAYDGIGRVFGADDFCAGIDLDNSLDETGQLKDWARTIFDQIPSYAEISPSGNGIKIWVRGRLGKGRTGRKKKIYGDKSELSDAVEIYDQARFFTMTGNHFPGSPRRVVDHQIELLPLYDRIFQPEPASKPRPSTAPTPRAGGNDNREERCRKYIDKCPNSISGSGGHDAFFRIVCETFKFDLSESARTRVLDWANGAKCNPSWSDKEVAHKIESARKTVTAAGEIGIRLRQREDQWDRWDAGQKHAKNANSAESTDGESAARVEMSDNFGEPIPLDAPALPELPDNIFPGWAGDMVNAAAVATEVPRELPAAICLAMLGTVAQGRFCVRPEPGYFEQLAFWTACALVSGSRKTPTMNAMDRWGFEWQKRKAAEFEPIIRKLQAEHAVLTGRIKVLRDKATKEDDATKRALLVNEADELEKQLPVVPVVPRLFVEDVTAEHLATLLAKHDERLTIISDEAGPLDNLGGRYSNGLANIDLLLKAYSGSAYFADRGSRPSVMLYHPLLSFALAPQPAVIAAMISNVTFRRRGLPARFIFLVPNSLLGYRKLETRPIPEHVASEYAARLTELADLPPAPHEDGGHKPRILTLSVDAHQLWKGFSHEVEGMLRPDGELEQLSDWAGKLPGACARIAGLFHLVEAGVEAIRLDEISSSTMGRAVEFCRFAIPHAKAVFEGMDGKGDLETARRMWREASSERHRQDRQTRYDDPTIISARDLWHPLRGSLKSVMEAEPSIRLLIDHGYLAELPNAEIGKPGRPSRRFKINPKLTEDW